MDFEVNLNKIEKTKFSSTRIGNEDAAVRALSNSGIPLRQQDRDVILHMPDLVLRAEDEHVTSDEQNSGTSSHFELASDNAARAGQITKRRGIERDDLMQIQQNSNKNNDIGRILTAYDAEFYFFNEFYFLNFSSTAHARSSP